MARLLPPLAVGAAAAIAAITSQKLLQRRHATERDSHPGGANPAPTTDRTADTNEPADLASELRGAASDLALALLDRATNRLEHAKP